MPEPSATLFLIRHAQADQGADDGGLTRRGEEQARALAAALGLREGDVLLSSPLRRARETAALLDRRHDVVEALAEFDFGPDAPGMEEMMAERSDLAVWRPDDGFRGGETLRAFQARVSALLDELVRANLGARVAGVTHAGVIDAAVRWAYGLGPEDAWTAEAGLPNASVTEIERWPRGRRPGGAPVFTIAHRVGDVSHLPRELVTEL